MPSTSTQGDIETINVTDLSGSYNDNGFKAGNAGATVRIADAPLKELPISVTNVTKDAIKSLGTTSTMDAVRNVAGVLVQTARDGRPSFRIRGFRDSGFALDGLKMTLPVPIPVDMVERVEVLKGPTSILTGVSSEGGLVNIVTKRPTAEALRETTLRVGTGSGSTASLDLGGIIGDNEGLTYRLVASGTHSKENDSGYGNANEFLFAPAVQWENEELRLLGGLRYHRNRLLPPNFTVLPAAEDDGSQSVLRVPRDVPFLNDRFGGPSEVLMWTAEQSYDAGDLMGMNVKFDNSFAYSRNRTKLHLFNVSADRQGPVQWYAQGYADSVLSDLGNKASVTLDYEGNLFKSSLKLGYDYAETRSTSAVGIGEASETNLLTRFPSVALDGGLTGELSEYSTNMHGVYALNKLDLFDNRLHALGSIRYDRFEESPGLTDGLTESVMKGSSWVGGIAYDLADWLTIYGNRSNGYVPGGVVNRRILPPQGRDLKEVGARFLLLDDYLTLSTALFELRKSNVKSVDFNNPDPDGPLIDIGGQRSRGLEIEAQGELAPGLNLIASFAFTKAESTNPGEESVVTGVPRYSGSIWLAYMFDEGWMDGVTLGGGVRAYSSCLISGNNAHAFRLPGYAIADASIGYRRDNLSFELKVNNVFNTYAFVPSVSSTYIGLENGRSAMLSLSGKF